jgi:putative lipoprotein
VIGRFRKENPGNPPFPFEITYDISRIDPSHRYAVRGRILVGGKLLFTTDQVYPVLTAWQGNEVALMLRSVPGPASGNSEASLEKTYWKLIRFGDTPVTAASEQQEAHLIFDPGIRRVSGSGGCNRLTGSFELNDNQLTFGPMATTMMACPESMDTEKKFLEALREVKTWKIEGQQLELSGAAGNVVARLEAHPLPTPARLP